MATTTISGSTTRNNGATVLNGGDVDTTNTVTNAVALRSNLDGSPAAYGTKVIAITGVQTSKGSGAIAYQPEAGDPQFLIRGYSTKVNNVSNTVLQSGGSEKAGRRAINALAKTHRYHITSINYVTGQATKGGSAGDVSNFVQTGDGSTAASDDAANPTRAIPGELVYMHGALTPKQDDYKAKTGG
jgi:hypothetical protein|tara:strand:- start:8487 stop:9044 length:558 start_codon:yes stop_codon:yes gene_type:complete